MMTAKPEFTLVGRIILQMECMKQDIVSHATFIFAHNSSRKEYYIEK
jgi:hypothetical protein